MTDQVQDQEVELDEEIEEAHDPKNAEAQSIASVDAAEEKGPRAKARKGDKSNSQKSELKGTATPVAKATAESVEIDGDFSEDLNALVESEATLSEDFKAKTAVIFEAAVKSKLAEEINRLEAEYQEQLDEEVKATKEDLVEKVDSYLNYVVEQWMEDNKLAIQSGLRSEIAEGFMSKLKDLFTESYVEVPESKIDLVDELATANEELEEQVNQATAKAIDLSEELESYKRKDIIREASRDLADTQVEKLTSLAEGISFESAEDFAAKVATLKESYFSAKTATSQIVEDAEDVADDAVELTGSMADYVAALRKSTK
jgi:methylphosphotriester-DNA--protein-cysteine methyltransferase